MISCGLCPDASSGGGTAEVSQGAAGGPAQGSAAGAESGGAGTEELSLTGGQGPSGQTHGGNCLVKGRENNSLTLI